jgi:hypothetical protein
VATADDALPRRRVARSSSDAGAGVRSKHTLVLAENRCLRGQQCRGGERCDDRRGREQ